MGVCPRHHRRPQEHRPDARAGVPVPAEQAAASQVTEATRVRAHGRSARAGHRLAQLCPSRHFRGHGTAPLIQGQGALDLCTWVQNPKSGDRARARDLAATLHRVLSDAS